MGKVKDQSGNNVLGILPSMTAPTTYQTSWGKKISIYIILEKNP
jgi:hypothetical protein